MTEFFLNDKLSLYSVLFQLKEVSALSPVLGNLSLSLSVVNAVLAEEKEAWHVCPM